MSTNIVPLTTCPFCDESGDVYIDTRAVTEENLMKLLVNEFDYGVASEILVFNSRSSDPGPCCGQSQGGPRPSFVGQWRPRPGIRKEICGS